MEYDKDFNKERGPDEKIDAKEEERRSKREEKLEEKRKKKEIIDQNKINRVLANCRLCLSNNFLMEEQILSNGRSTILVLPDISKFSNLNYD
jgi:hypothetical protein